MPKCMRTSTTRTLFALSCRAFSVVVSQISQRNNHELFRTTLLNLRVGHPKILAPRQLQSVLAGVFIPAWVKPLSNTPLHKPLENMRLGTTAHKQKGVLCFFHTPIGSKILYKLYIIIIIIIYRFLHSYFFLLFLLYEHPFPLLPYTPPSKNGKTLSLCKCHQRNVLYIIHLGSSLYSRSFTQSNKITRV